MNKKVERFAYNYENKIKDIRELYYKYNTEDSSITYLLIPVLTAFVILLCLVTEFNYISLGISFLILLIGNILNNIINHHNYKLRYLVALLKIGYINIYKYEKDLNNYLTGKNGYYKFMLDSYIKEYNLSEYTDIIRDLNNVPYYAFFSENGKRFIMLNASLKEKPEIIKYDLGNIRYFRKDTINNRVILVTDLANYSFNLDSYNVFNKLFKEKNYVNIRIFDPEEYINDYELFMHNYEANLNKRLKDVKISDDIINIIILFIICIGLSFVLTLDFMADFKIIIYILSSILLIASNSFFKNLFPGEKIKRITDNELINLANSDKECIDHFKELKIALNIKDQETLRIRSDEGAEYLTWVKNGYFHLFLNLIYTNAVYIVVKTTDIDNYEVTRHETIIRFKDRVLHFDKDAGEIFSRILPNKEADMFSTKRR